MYVPNEYHQPSTQYENLHHQQLEQTTQHFQMPQLDGGEFGGGQQFNNKNTSKTEINQGEVPVHDNANSNNNNNNSNNHQDDNEEIIPVEMDGQTLYIRVNKSDPTKPPPHEAQQQLQQPPPHFMQPVMQQEYSPHQSFIPPPNQQFLPMYDHSQQQQPQQHQTSYPVATHPHTMHHPGTVFITQPMPPPPPPPQQPPQQQQQKHSPPQQPTHFNHEIRASPVMIPMPQQPQLPKPGTPTFHTQPQPPMHMIHQPLPQQQQQQQMFPQPTNILPNKKINQNNNSKNNNNNTGAINNNNNTNSNKNNTKTNNGQQQQSAIMYSSLPTTQTQKKQTHPSQMLFQDLPQSNNHGSSVAMARYQQQQQQQQHVKTSTPPHSHHHQQHQQYNQQQQQSSHHTHHSHQTATTRSTKQQPPPQQQQQRLSSSSQSGATMISQIHNNDRRTDSMDHDDSNAPFKPIPRNILRCGQKSSLDLSTSDSYYSESDESTHNEIYRLYHDDLHHMLQDKVLETKDSRELDTILSTNINPFPNRLRSRPEKLQAIKKNSHKLLDRERFQRLFQRFRTFNESHYMGLYKLYSNENLNTSGMLNHFHEKAAMEGSQLAHWLSGIFFLVPENELVERIRKLWKSDVLLPGLNRTFFEIIQEAIMDDQLYLLKVLIPLIKFINNQILRAPKVYLRKVEGMQSYSKSYRGSKLNLKQLQQIVPGTVYKTAMYLSTCKTMQEASKYVGSANIFIIFHIPQACKYIGSLLGKENEFVLIPPYTSVHVKRIRRVDNSIQLTVEIFAYNRGLPESQTTILL